MGVTVTITAENAGTVARLAEVIADEERLLQTIYAAGRSGKPGLPTYLSTLRATRREIAQLEKQCREPS